MLMPMDLAKEIEENKMKIETIIRKEEADNAIVDNAHTALDIELDLLVDYINTYK